MRRRNFDDRGSGNAYSKKMEIGAIRASEKAKTYLLNAYTNTASDAASSTSLVHLKSCK
jgi:hypothetical protein